MEKVTTVDLRKQAIDKKVPYCRFMRKGELQAALDAQTPDDIEAIVAPVRARVAEFDSTKNRKSKPTGEKPAKKAATPKQAEAKIIGTLRNLKGEDKKYNGHGVVKVKGGLDQVSTKVVEATTETGVTLTVRRYQIVACQ